MLVSAESLWSCYCHLGPSGPLLFFLYKKFFTAIGCYGHGYKHEGFVDDVRALFWEAEDLEIFDAKLAEFYLAWPECRPTTLALPPVPPGLDGVPAAVPAAVGDNWQCVVAHLPAPPPPPPGPSIMELIQGLQEANAELNIQVQLLQDANADLRARVQRLEDAA